MRRNRLHSENPDFSIGGLNPAQLAGLAAGLIVIETVFPAICHGALVARRRAGKDGDFVKAGRLLEVAKLFAPVPASPDVFKFALRRAEGTSP